MFCVFSQRAQYQDKLARQRYEDQLRQQVRSTSSSSVLNNFVTKINYNNFPFPSAATLEWGEPSQAGGVRAETGGHEERYQTSQQSMTWSCQSIWSLSRFICCYFGCYSNDRARDGAEAQEWADAHRGRGESSSARGEGERRYNPRANPPEGSRTQTDCAGIHKVNVTLVVIVSVFSSPKWRCQQNITWLGLVSFAQFDWMCFPVRTAGAVFGEGFKAFVSDWDKVTATVRSYIYF